VVEGGERGGKGVFRQGYQFSYVGGRLDSERKHVASQNLQTPQFVGAYKGLERSASWLERLSKDSGELSIDFPM
jgi:hypothetical protein